MKPKIKLAILLITTLTLINQTNANCNPICDVALASYFVWEGSNLTFIAKVLASKLIDKANQDFPDIQSYNPGKLINKDFIRAGDRINVPFPCECLVKPDNTKSLGHTFEYDVITGDTYDKVAKTYYVNLTTTDNLERENRYPAVRIPDQGAVLNVTVACFCGDADVSKDYGLFVTYPLRSGDNLKSVAQMNGVEESLLTRYNPGVDFSAGSGIVYVPGKDKTGNFPKLKTSKGIAPGIIAGIVVAVIASVLLLGICVYMLLRRNKKLKNAMLLPTSQELSQGANVPVFPTGGVSTGASGVLVDKSVEFSYEELAQATDNFSLVNKIGQGGFGAVYYAELRGEKAAIKKMDVQQSKEFYAELKVLTHVHHVNLVRLIGFCIEGAFILVYEYIENGNLSQNLRDSGRSILPWSTRVQIALDSARGLEYIHEHTVPVYIHRDIKPANILIDKNFRGKVADFGLAKLTEVVATTRLVGTFGYMPPEYAQYGEVSAKVDVFAFGVVMYELISAKEPIVKPNDSSDDSKGLVAMFDEAFNQPDPEENLLKLVDPRLADNYSFDEVQKMARIAKACTNENPQLRPSMRSVVVDLMTLSSSTGNWDTNVIDENESTVSLMSGR